MQDLLAMPEVRERLSRLSLDEYHRLDEFNQNGRRTELIRGFVVEKMSKSPLHSFLSKWLYDWFAQADLVGLIVRHESPLTLSDSEPEPDVAIVQGQATDFLRGHPRTALLVIEVSVTNPSLDRANAALYAEANVREYWIILADKQTIEVYRRPEQGRYLETSSYASDALLKPLSFPAPAFRVATLFQDVPKMSVKGETKS